MNRIPQAVDMVVYDHEEHPVLLTEVKAVAKRLSEVQAMVAEQFRRTGMLEARYFLLAMPQQFYLWTKPASTLVRGVPPQFTIDTQQLLGPYAHEHGIINRLASGAKVSHDTLEFLIETWLDLLLDPRSSELVQSGQRAFLVESGLLAAIQGGTLVSASTAH